MPATFAHPVFAIPFRRLGLPMSALVLGSMAPDLAYVLPFWHPWMAHSLVGVFTFGTPVGLLAWVLFQRWVKPGLYQAAPAPVAEAFADLATPPRWAAASTWLVALLGAAVGAATHVGVDELTHAYGWGPHALPEIFASPLLPSPFGLLPLYKCLQYGFGVGGSAILALWVLQDYRRGPRRAWRQHDLHRALRIAGAGLAAVGVGLTHGLLEARAEQGTRALKVLAVQSAAATLVLTVVGLLAWGWICALGRRSA